MPHVAELLHTLRSGMRGEVRGDPQIRATHASDASNFREVPQAVVFPADEADVVAAVDACRRLGVPITSRGGGTALAGQTVGSGVVLDTSRHLTRILEVDPERRLARVQPGVVLDRLREACWPHGLTFGPDPATHDRCTLGGMIGNNSCGVHSVLAGRTADNVSRLKVVTSDGECFWVGRTDAESRATMHPSLRARLDALTALRDRHADEIRARYPRIPRRVSGYNLDALLPERGAHLARSLVGSEGTCVVVVEAELELVPWPASRALVAAGYPSLVEAAEHVPRIRALGPIGLEGFDAVLVRLLRTRGGYEDALEELPPGEGWLLVEVGGATPDEARQAAERMARALRATGRPCAVRVIAGREDQDRLWKVRESALAVTTVTDGQPAYEGWEDSAVPPEHLGAYLRRFRELLDRYGYRSSLYGHFGDGCVHARITFDLGTEAGLAKTQAFLRDAARLVVSFGGSLSGEHGDGQQRAALLPLMFGDRLVDAFREFRRIWDPHGILNPGKIVDAAPMERHLKEGPSVRVDDPPTTMAFERGSFAWAVSRCVGVGACRKAKGGVMCPSYRATMREEHSTRGRAHLLQEMLRRDGPIESGWRDEAVADALDLCLSCKACKTECPMDVDMAKMKAEVLHHRYRGRVRPRAAYAMGLVPLWARAASLAPGLANGLLAAPGIGAGLKWAAGMSPRRAPPLFARRTFRSWWRRHARQAPADGADVILWVDTWTDHFRPEVGVAAVEVLEATGHRVHVTRRPVCCGRPLYEHGMLGVARRWLDEACRQLEALPRAPIVFLEPSCHSTFRDELLGFWPDDEARRAIRSRIRTLAEQLATARAATDGWRFERPVLVHGHCHQRSGTGLKAELELLRRIGAEAELLDDGCCGMAGTFGYEPRKVDLSLAIAEGQGFLPAMRSADPSTALLVDGFSCGSQLTDQVGREPLHLAQILSLARRQKEESMTYRPIERAKEYFNIAEYGGKRVAIAASVFTAVIALVVGVVMASMRVVRTRAA